MDSEARLLRALAAGQPPARDPRFALAVIEAAAAERFRWDMSRAVLKGAGLAAALAALALPFASWAGGHAEGLQTGLLGAGGLVAIVALARLLAARTRALLPH